MNLTRIFAGAIWVTSATVAGRLAGFVSQFVLGWLLTKQDFGSYAILLSLAITVSALRNGGTHQYLIQKGGEYEELAPIVLSFSFLFNSVAAVMLVIVTYFANAYYQSDALVQMALLMGVAIFIASPGLILRAKLAIEGRFKELSIALAASDLFRQLFVISLALLGSGVFSFVIPLVTEPLFLFAAFFYWVREFHPPKWGSFASYLSILKDTRWIMLSNLAIALRLNGQYLAISIFEDRLFLGVFFFASQLITSVTSMVSTAVNEVVFPSLAKVSDSSLQREMGALMIRVAAVLGSLISILIMIVAPAVIGFLWSAKWNDSIEIVLVLASAIPAVIIAAIIFAEFAAQGLWGKRLVAMIFASSGEFIVAILLAFFYDIAVVAIGLVVFRWVVVGVLLVINAQVDNPYLNGRFFVWLLVCATLVATSCLTYFYISKNLQMLIQLSALAGLCLLISRLYWQSRKLMRMDSN